MTSPMIVAKGLSFSYRSSERSLKGQPIQNPPILKGISLSIPEGEMVAIRGPSGSGKSTLLYLLGGLARPDQGSIEIDGQDLTAVSSDELARIRNHKIGFVFQQFHLLPKLTVLDNILLPSLYRKDQLKKQTGDSQWKEKARLLAKKLGIQDQLDSFPNKISGGQQQRAAIARALLGGAKIILADEPTGNLDSQSSQQIMELLKKLNQEGTTVLIITHDPEIASQCSQQYFIRDGVLEGQAYAQDVKNSPATVNPKSSFFSNFFKYFTQGKKLASLAVDNLLRNRVRSLLTMLGIVIGIGAVLSIITLGRFTRKEILKSYANLGVNTLLFKGHPNWKRRATDQISSVYRSLDMDKDLLPLKTNFPQVLGVSPLLSSWGVAASFGGRIISSGIVVFGIGSDGIEIANHELQIGSRFSQYHMEDRAAVCIIGAGVVDRLFSERSPVGQILHLQNEQVNYGCRILGVLKAKESNQQGIDPNLYVLLPYSSFQGSIGNWWESQTREALIRVKDGIDIEKLGRGLKAFFRQKYGNSGFFRVDSNSLLVAQMQKFFDLFTALLGVIAFLSLVVGGIGITNMMLVSVSERLKEIGIRKAVGATNFNIRVQFLMEAVILCLVAGVIGLLLGFGVYEALIFLASQFVSGLSFQWVFAPNAFFISLLSIVAVGILSGLIPALKAERLEVIDALRSE